LKGQRCCSQTVGARAKRRKRKRRKRKRRRRRRRERQHCMEEILAWIA
jgi:hypothetical protein